MRNVIAERFQRIPLRRQIILLVLIGLLIRLILMPFTMHVDPHFTGDIASFPYSAALWTSPSQGNITYYIYPPLAYHTFAAYMLHIVQPLIRDMVALPIYGTEAQLNWISNPQVFRTLFILKLWYLLPDLGILWLLWKLYKEREKQARLAVLAWAFNPLVLYTAYFHGQFDLAPVFLVVLSLFLAQRKHGTWSVIAMGLGAAYKNFPLFFMFPLVLMLDQGWKGRIRLLLIGTISYAIFFLPYMGMGTYQSFGSAMSNSFFKAGYDLGQGAHIYIFFAYLAIVYWLFIQKINASFEDLWRACFAILLVYFQTSYFDLHYWVWIAPFAIFFWVEYREKASIFYLVILAFLLVLLSPIPIIRYLAPLAPQSFLRMPSLLEALGPYVPALLITNIFRSLLAGTCFYLSWQLIRGFPGQSTGVAKTRELE